MFDTFQDRRTRGEAFADAIQRLLQYEAVVDFTIRAGVEKHAELAQHLRQIHRSNDVLARRLRFNPDGMFNLLGHGFCHWEAKASPYMERDPYLHYGGYEERGEPVVMFIGPRLCETSRPDSGIYVGRLGDLVLKHGSETESRYPNPAPVDADGWIRRDLDPRPFKGSKTPFREIDFNKSKLLMLTTARLVRDDYCQIANDFFIGDTIKRSWKR